jgi:Zn-finger nucleic acid-binding protein
MRATENAKAEMWSCDGCNGLWVALDGHEVELGDLTSFWDAIEQAGKATKITCPVCPDESLRIVKFGGCKLDACSECKGIFFDNGELDKIRAFLEQAKAPTLVDR